MKEWKEKCRDWDRYVWGEVEYVPLNMRHDKIMDPENMRKFVVKFKEALKRSRKGEILKEKEKTWGEIISRILYRSFFTMVVVLVVIEIGVYYCR